MLTGGEKQCSFVSDATRVKFSGKFLDVFPKTDC